MPYHIVYSIIHMCVMFVGNVTLFALWGDNMTMATGNLYFDKYSPVGDIVVIAVCSVILVLVLTSFIKKSKSFGLFMNMVIYIVLAAVSDIIYHNAFNHITDSNYTIVYIFRILYHIFLFSILLLYVVYILEIQRIEMSRRYNFMLISTLLYIAVIVLDIVMTVTGSGFHINSDRTVTQGSNIFLWGYLAFMVVILYLMIANRNRIYRQVMNGFYGTMSVAFIILYLEGRAGQSSYTVATFLLPVLAMLYLIHSTPYNIEIGAISAIALRDTISYNYNRNIDFIFMSMLLPDFDVEGKSFSKELQEVIRRFSNEFFKGSILFQVSNGHVVMFARKKNNPDYENKINMLINAFYPEYEKFQYDYKIVVGESIEEISRKNEYISFIKNIYRNMEMNSFHMVNYDDVTSFNRYEYILEELGDIYRRRDLRDSRVLAYCQPVYNIAEKKYDTAEALMRLKLPEIGLVYPDQFIPLAEENGYIHVLTEIILQKSCDEIRHLLSEGYDVKRISVNVSVLELRDEGFTDDIHRIIEASGIPEDKIAIEITESQSESDFMLMKDKVEELKEKGIKFYLDDFGTGYSNMERIMEVPFDIIKFDRSLVLASDSNEKSESMVSSLANMFSKLEYSVLYEGVENDLDEERCINMHATYLQGYKYSRPIPIIELSRFFTKIV